MARMEKIYLGRENRLVRELTRAGAVLGTADKEAITRVQAWINDEHCLDTDNPAHPIEYDDGVVTMQAGLVAGLEPGEATIHLTVYDPEHSDGLAWGSFEAEVLPWPTCEATP